MKTDLKRLKEERDFTQEKGDVIVERSGLAHILDILIPLFEKIDKRLDEIERR